MRKIREELRKRILELKLCIIHKDEDCHRCKLLGERGESKICLRGHHAVLIESSEAEAFPVNHRSTFYDNSTCTRAVGKVIILQHHIDDLGPLCSGL